MELILLIILLAIIWYINTKDNKEKSAAEETVARKRKTFQDFENKYGDPILEDRIADELSSQDMREPLEREVYGILGTITGWDNYVVSGQPIPRQVLIDVLMINRGKLPRHQWVMWFGWMQIGKAKKDEIVLDYELAKWMSTRIKVFHPELKMLAHYEGVSPSFVWKGSRGDYSETRHIGVYKEVLSETTD